MIVNPANKEFNFLNHGAPGGEWDMTIILLMIHIPLIVAAKFGAKNEKLKFGLITVSNKLTLSWISLDNSNNSKSSIILSSNFCFFST